MSQENQSVTFEQYIATLRNQIIISYDGAKETALRNFDDLAKRLAESLVQRQQPQTEQPQTEQKTEKKKKQ